MIPLTGIMGGGISTPSAATAASGAQEQSQTIIFGGATRGSSTKTLVIGAVAAVVLYAVLKK